MRKLYANDIQYGFACRSSHMSVKSAKKFQTAAGFFPPNSKKTFCLNRGRDSSPILQGYIETP
jgi:hypothetical protein